MPFENSELWETGLEVYEDDEPDDVLILDEELCRGCKFFVPGEVCQVEDCPV